MSKEPKHRPIVFVHGFSSGDGGVWDGMKSHAQRAGYENKDLYTFDVDPKQSLVSNSQAIGKAIEELARANGPQVDIIAHSMGGLSTLYYMRKNGGAQHVKNFVSLGGPGRGSDVAEFVNSPAGSSLKGSALVTNLPADLDEGDPEPGGTRYATFRSSGGGTAWDIVPGIDSADPKSIAPQNEAIARQLLKKLDS